MIADALIMMRMNLSLEGAQPIMRDGWYIDGSKQKRVQSMIFPENHKLKGKPKGIKQVLKKCNL